VRPAQLAVVALLSALLGTVAAIAIGKSTGWISDDGTATVVVPALSDPRAGSPPGIARPVARPLPAGAFDPARLYAERSTGVVTIYAFFAGDESAAQASQGSGFVVSPEGYVLTSSHVITNAGEQARVSAAEHVYVEFSDGDRAPARVVGWDVFDDVGLLKVEPSAHALAPVPLGDSARVVVGEPVAAIGSPFGKEDSLATGVVSATGRSIDSLTSRFTIPDAIQTDAPINHGNSGGPLFDARGRVIGINAQIRSGSGQAEGVGFAVPINAARRSMEQLLGTGRVVYPYVGIVTHDLTPSAARRYGFATRQGAVVVDVNPGTPAERAGLKAATNSEFFQGDPAVPTNGDVVVAIAGVPVTSSDDVLRIVSGRLTAGKRAIFTIVRGSRRLQVPIVLAKRPATQSA
jgi:S1-C subfamily serine protease